MSEHDAHVVNSERIHESKIKSRWRIHLSTWAIALITLFGLVILMVPGHVEQAN